MPTPIDARTSAGKRPFALATVGVAMAVVMAALLAAGYLQLRSAAQLLVRGEAGVLLESVRDALRQAQPATEADLSAALDAQSAAGVRYIGLLDEDGQVHRRAGTAQPEGPPLRRETRPGELEDVGGGVLRTVGGYPPPPRPRPAAGEAPPPPDDKPPRPRNDNRGPAFPRLIVEFEPRWSDRLDRTAGGIGLVGALLVLVMLALGLVSVRLQRSHDGLVRRLEHDRHLRSLGELSAVLAHEIRNPLASLKGHAQLLAEALPEESREREKAERVVNEAMRLETLSTDLLAFARTGTCDRQPVDVGALLRDVATLGEGRVEVTVAEPLTWSLDGRGMRQVLTNIVQNALDAAPPETRVELSARVTDGALNLTIRDHGPGIAAGDEERIFEPFQTDKIHGTGLGLAVARRMTGLHGGTVVARTHPEGGALFEIHIPEG